MIKVRRPAATAVLVLLLFAASIEGCKRRMPPLAGPSAPAEAGASYRIEWVTVSAPATFKPGETLTFPVSVRNVGTMPLSNTQLAISYHWNDAADPKRVVVWDGLRTAVLFPLKPGQIYSTELRVRAPEEPGDYVLNVDMVREGVAWFSGKRAPASSHPVSVR